MIAGSGDSAAPVPEKSYLPTVTDIKKAVEAAGPEGLKDFEDISAYQARIERLRAVSEMEAWKAYIADRRSFRYISEKDIGEILNLAHVENVAGYIKPGEEFWNKVPLVEYIDIGYLAETAQEIYEAGYPPAYVIAMLRGWIPSPYEREPPPLPPS
jgi:hypothetical protein